MPSPSLVVFRGPWAAHAYYYPGDAATSSGVAYVCTRSHRAQSAPASDTDHWLALGVLLGEGGTFPAPDLPATIAYTDAGNTFGTDQTISGDLHITGDLTVDGSVPGGAAGAPTVQQVFNGTTLDALPVSDVVALFMESGIGLLPNADQVPGQRVWVSANTTGLTTTLHASDQEHGFNLNGLTCTSLAFAGGHGLLLAVGTTWYVMGGSPTGGYY